MKKQFTFLVQLFLISFLIFSCSEPTEQKESINSTAWSLAKEIEAQIVVPTFPDNIFNVSDYGVKANTTINNSVLRQI